MILTAEMPHRHDFVRVRSERASGVELVPLSGLRTVVVNALPGRVLRSYVCSLVSDRRDSGGRL